MNGHKVYYQLSTEKTAGSLYSDKITFTPNVTHVQVGMVSADWGLDDIFNYFNWMTGNREGNCPKEFTAKLQATEGLHHSSMSVGDVVVQSNGHVFVCASIGWRELVKSNQSFLEEWS